MTSREIIERVYEKLYAYEKKHKWKPKYIFLSTDNFDTVVIYHKHAVRTSHVSGQYELFGVTLYPINTKENIIAISNEPITEI